MYELGQTPDKECTLHDACCLTVYQHTRLYKHLHWTEYGTTTEPAGATRTECYRHLALYSHNVTSIQGNKCNTCSYVFRVHSVGIPCVTHAVFRWLCPKRTPNMSELTMSISRAVRASPISIRISSRYLLINSHELNDVSHTETSSHQRKVCVTCTRRNKHRQSQ